MVFDKYGGRYFQEEGFIYLQSPLITASDCEGAGMLGCTYARLRKCDRYLIDDVILHSYIYIYIYRYYMSLLYVETTWYFCCSTCLYIYLPNYHST